MVQKPPDSQNYFSRRHFLQTLAAIPVLHRVALNADQPSGGSFRSPFEEVPPSISGINWTHVNGRSPMAHLPETVGAGCAFLDYDNDGWMDIYLVNSGPCDF